MKYSRSLIATLLMSGGLLSLVPPALADGTASGTNISNTATASYDDPTGIGSINATSNTVNVVVAEIAGITLTPSGIVNQTNPGSPITVGDQLYYNYTITNVGNAPTKFNIPSNPGITGPGSITGVEYSTDGGTNWITTTGTPTPLVGVNGTILVRVAVATNNNAGSPTIKVTLGNGTPDGTSQPFVASGANDDVNTTGGNPVNGQRESAAVQQTNVGAAIKNIAIATVLEKQTGIDNNGTPSVVTDDIISYQLGLNVASSYPADPSITPVALTGTSINLDSTNVKRILLSSVVPSGTTLIAATSPPGYKAVYTTDPTSTIANAANWSSSFIPGTAYTRVGFVNDPNVTTTVATGSNITGFTFKVKTTGATGSAYTVDSMAQVFGATASGDPNVVVYDESGDQTPNNADPAVPLSPTNSTLSVAVTSGSANGVATATYGIDTNNDNTGTGAAGEINQTIYSYNAPAVNSLLNGTFGIPNSTGLAPDNTQSDNFDFTNKSSAVPAGTAPGSQIDPPLVGFANTVKNTGNTPADISFLPELLTTPGTAPLPIGTRIRIYTSGGSAQSATYTTTATGLAFTNGSTGITATNPLKIAGISSGASTDYQVEIDLPSGTDLSTTTGKGFPVVINAFTGGTVAVTNGDVAVTNPTASNKTIDRVYTGFVRLVKESQILQGTGPNVPVADSTFSTAAKNPAPGNIIVYRITFTNISEKPVGIGNSALNAANLAIVEDGTTGTNTWAKTNTNGVITTSNIFQSAVNVGATGTVEYYNGANGTNNASDASGTSVTTDVTKYIDRITTVVAPGDTGSFSFKRALN